MKLKKVDLNKDGEVETVWVLSTDQYYFLIHYAINHLIQKGLASSETITEEEFKKLQQEAESDLQKQFLTEVDPKDLSQA